MRNFSELEIEKWLDVMDENVLEREELLGRCFACGKELAVVELPDGPEKKVVCLNHRDHFVENFEEWEEEGQL